MFKFSKILNKIFIVAKCRFLSRVMMKFRFIGLESLSIGLLVTGGKVAGGERSLWSKADRIDSVNCDNYDKIFFVLSS